MCPCPGYPLSSNDHCLLILAGCLHHIQSETFLSILFLYFSVSLRRNGGQYCFQSLTCPMRERASSPHALYIWLVQWRKVRSNARNMAIIIVIWIWCWQQCIFISICISVCKKRCSSPFNSYFVFLLSYLHEICSFSPVDAVHGDHNLVEAVANIRPGHHRLSIFSILAWSALGIIVKLASA